MDRSPWRLETYFFTDQRIAANPTHDPHGARDGHAITTNHSVVDLPGRTNAIGVEVEIALDEAKSDNHAYTFAIRAFGILSAEAEVGPEWRNPATMMGLSMLIGGIREHLAAMTARGPWGSLLIGPVMLRLDEGPPSLGSE